VDAPTARIRQLTIGALHAEDVRAAVQDIDASGRTGLLGMNVLGSYRMTVDHARGLLLLEPK
jgi:predicted aspartyl protease